MRDWQRRGTSVDAMRELARAELPRAVFDFADGGAETEWSLRNNETAWRAHQIVPRPLRGSPARDLSIELFGQRLSMPLILGPTGLAGLFWPDAECCAARAAKAAGIGVCLSHGSVCTLETFAETGVAPRWMQVFVYRDRGFTRELAERAAAAGYNGLVLTIDNQLTGNRERDLRNGFTIPPKPGLAGIAASVTKLRWLARMRRELPKITFGNYIRPGEASDLASLASRMGELLDPSMAWRDVETLRDEWHGTLILKGVLHPDDAKAAIERGIDGVIVSNHGGRQLDCAPAPADVLAAVVDAAGGRIPVMVDGGIRRGGDILKALALGAAACLIGRPQLWGVAVAGEAGVAHVIELYRRELDRAMGLCGLSAIGTIDRRLLLDSVLADQVHRPRPHHPSDPPTEEQPQ